MRRDDYNVLMLSAGAIMTAASWLTGCISEPPPLPQATGAAQDGGETSMSIDSTGLSGNSTGSISVGGGSTTMDSTTSTTGVAPTTEANDTTMGIGETSLSTTTASTTGDPPGLCHPKLAEVLYDPGGADDNRQWIKLYNDCPDPIDLSDYSIGWGGADYTVGTLDLEGTIDPDGCFIVGGPESSDNNNSPILDQEIDLDPDLLKSGVDADGIALFFGTASDIMPDTVPEDAVIYGFNNTSDLLDEHGDAPPPHVDDALSGESIRLDAPDSWIIELDPMPNQCPPF